MIAAILLALTLQAASASPEAEALGQRIAATGTLATLLPLMSAKESEELVAAHPELTAAEQAELRAIAAATAAEGSARLIAAEGHSYAIALSIKDLRALAAFSDSDAAKHQRAAMPRIIGQTMQSAGQMDFQGEVMKAFCAKTGKGYPAK